MGIKLPPVLAIISCLVWKQVAFDLFFLYTYDADIWVTSSYALIPKTHLKTFLMRWTAQIWISSWQRIVSARRVGYLSWLSKQNLTGNSLQAKRHKKPVSRNIIVNKRSAHLEYAKCNTLRNLRETTNRVTSVQHLNAVRERCKVIASDNGYENYPTTDRNVYQ